MHEVAQQILNALSLGGTYALLALGLAIVYSVLGFVNFAHGELMTVTAYTMLFLGTQGWSFPLIVIGGIAAAATSAVLMERLAFRPLRNASMTSMLLTSFALSQILQLVFVNFASPLPKAVAIPAELSSVISVLGVRIGRIQAFSLIATALTLALLVWFLRRTQTGLAIRAAAEDFGTTRLMSVPANRVIAIAFALSGAVAGVAAVLWVSQRGSTSPDLGFVPVIKAFVAATLGGLRSLQGAALGGLTLGVIEVSLQALLPVGVQPFREALTLSLVIAVLVFRPDGIYAPRDPARRRIGRPNAKEVDSA